jgi:hypothetical protein
LINWSMISLLKKGSVPGVNCMLISFMFKQIFEIGLFVKMHQKRAFKVSDHQRINKQILLIQAYSGKL